VIDNFGDIGVCWRLAADLAARGQQVRLWLDDPRALAWMAPRHPPGITVVPWGDAPPALAPADVVVEAFGCNPPEAFVARMATSPRPPVWINLEYLSAEAYVARSHRLSSPQWQGVAAGLMKWFFYPGFTTDTGGLLREPALIDTLAAPDPEVVFQSLGLQRRPHERCISVFSYDNPGLADLPVRCADQPTLLLATPGPASKVLLHAPLPAQVRVQAMPWLPQSGYDALLRACDLNFVRGEDSFLRAQWAAKPFVWQIYPQHDGVHAAKLEAFLALHLAGADPALAGAIHRWSLAWNGLPGNARPTLPPTLPDLAKWQGHTRRWCDQLLTQQDLSTQLLDFVAEKR
jgi:uncharacterized repeat protein (TIGR03837 family)